MKLSVKKWNVSVTKSDAEYPGNSPKDRKANPRTPPMTLAGTSALRNSGTQFLSKVPASNMVDIRAKAMMPWNVLSIFRLSPFRTVVLELMWARLAPSC